MAVAPRTGLPEPKWERLSGGGIGAIDLDTISLLLAAGAGWREDRPERVQRWTASGGNIGSPTAYLVAREVDGLSLALRLSRAQSRISTVAGPDDGTGMAVDPAVELDVCALGAGRTGTDRGFGSRGSQVRRLRSAGGAARRRLRSGHRTRGRRRLRRDRRPESDWDDARVATLLSLDPMTEPVTGLLVLSPTAPSTRPSTVDNSGGASVNATE